MKLYEYVHVQAAAAAAPAASGTSTQRSEAEGAGKSARFGNPKHAYTAAIKRALALKDARVLGAFAQLGTVQDVRVSELIGSHLTATLRTLVVQDRDCRCAGP